jgi:hypothetical protein
MARTATTTDVAAIQARANPLGETGMVVGAQMQVEASALVGMVSEEQVRLSEMIGAIKMAMINEKFLNVSRVKMLAELKESKQYKGMLVNGPGKLSRRVGTWEEVCAAIGLSVSIVDESIRNLSVLGEAFLEDSQSLGLGYRQLRALRKLPDDERALVLNNEAIQTGDKDALMELIEDLTARHAKEKTQLTQERDEAKARYEARKTLLDQQGAEVQSLREQVAQLRNPAPHEAAALERAQEEMVVKSIKTAAELMHASVMRFAKAIADSTMMQSEPVETLRNETVRWLFQRINQVAVDYGVEVSFEEVVNPPWLTAMDADGDGDRAH